VARAGEPKQGHIVWATVCSPQGTYKKRPLVIISPTDEILLDREIVAVAVTTTFAHPAPPDHVELPWFRAGHPATGLKRRSAAVCTWLVNFQPSDIISIMGFVPTRYLMQILDRVSELD
jgi:mRNA-degrading endonuclease toxin of MazEF toxin-antitoxin module